MTLVPTERRARCCVQRLVPAFPSAVSALAAIGAPPRRPGRGGVLRVSAIPDEAPTEPVQQVRPCLAPT